MRVYRLEFCGNGPYNAPPRIRYKWESLHVKILDAHRDDPMRPTWGRDFGDGIWADLSPKYKAGCVTLDQLVEWFGEFLLDLYNVGFNIVEYDGYDCLFSEHQVAFIPGRKVRKLPRRLMKELAEAN